MADSTLAPIKSAWASKINWLQLVGVICGAATAIVGGNMLGLSAEQTAHLVAGINLAQGVLTVVLRTFFSNSVVENSLPNP